LCHGQGHQEQSEEIFYPAFLKQAEEEDIHHEAVVEHAGAKSLIRWADFSQLWRRMSVSTFRTPPCGPRARIPQVD
jgi:hypothetical protein